MDITNVVVGSILIPNDTFCPLINRMASGVQVIEVNDKGFKMKRMNLYHNGETYFLTKQALEQSQLVPAPINSQLRFL